MVISGYATTENVFYCLNNSASYFPRRCSIVIQIDLDTVMNNYRGQPKAGTSHKMQFVPFVFSKSRFQVPLFRFDKIVVIVTLLEAIEGNREKEESCTSKRRQKQGNHFEMNRNLVPT